jgi:hypothetical protein
MSELDDAINTARGVSKTAAQPSGQTAAQPSGQTAAQPSGQTAAQPANQGGEAGKFWSIFGPGYGAPPGGDKQWIAQGSEYDPTWKPTGDLLVDLLTRPVAKTESVPEAARDVGLSALDTASLGVAPRALGMGDLAVRAHENMGLMDYPLSTAVYAAAPGQVLGRVAGRIAGKGIMGAALEGGLASGGSAAGHGGTFDDILHAAATGALLSGGISSAATAAGPTVNLAAGKLGLGGDTAADVTASLKADRDAKYDALNNVFYHPNDALAMVNNVKGDIIGKDPGGDLLANAPKTSAALKSFENQVSNNPTTTAGGLGTLHRRLGEIMGGPNGGAEAEIASPFRNRVEEMMNTAQPVNPGLSPGDAADMLADAKQAHGLYANANRLQGYQENLNTFGNMPVKEAQAELRDNPNFYQGPGQREAMTNIGNAGRTALPNWAAPTGLGAAGWALGGGPTGAGLGAALGAAMDVVQPMAQRAAARRAIIDAYPALTSKTLANPEQTVGNLLMKLTAGRLSSGIMSPTNVLSNLPMSGYIYPWLPR